MFGVQRNGLEQMLQMLNAVNKPEDLFKQVYNTNPQFKQFVEENKGLTIEQMLEKSGIKLQ